ncbi:MAG: ATP-binding protein [Bacillota bacterium]
MKCSEDRISKISPGLNDDFITDSKVRNESPSDFLPPYIDKKNLSNDPLIVRQDITELTRIKERFEILSQTASDLLRSTELQSTVQNICHRLMEFLSCQVFFNFITIGKETLYLNAYYGIPGEEAEKIKYLEFGTAICGCVARDGKSIVAEYVQTSGDLRANLVRSYGVKAYASHPLLSEGGKVIGTLSFGTTEREIFDGNDISLMQAVADQVAIAMIRMNDQKLLKESEERFSAAFRSNPNALILSRTDDGVILDVNNSFIDLVEWSRDEIIGRNSLPLNIFPDPEERSKITDLLKQKKHLLDHEVTILTKYGHKRLVLLSSNLLKMTQGEIFLLSLQDITEQRKVEQRLHRMMTELEDSNNQLKQFAYVASHDLQEPLRMVSSYMMMLEKRYKDQLDDRAKEYIFYATDGAKRMNELIHDLLSYSRLTAKTESFVEVDLNNTMADISRDLQIAIAETKTIIDFDHMPVIKASPVQIKQLFQNLIQNAIKFRDDENPLIKITFDSDDKEWTFSIKDNGIGISPEHHEKIFLLFQRLHERHKYPGTGLGLAICRKIVERHGGRIWVESEVGNGSNFMFTINKQTS